MRSRSLRGRRIRVRHQRRQGRNDQDLTRHDLDSESVDYLFTTFVRNYRGYYSQDCPRIATTQPRDGTQHDQLRESRPQGGANLREEGRADRAPAARSSTHQPNSRRLNDGGAVLHDRPRLRHGLGRAVVVARTAASSRKASSTSHRSGRRHSTRAIRTARQNSRTTSRVYGPLPKALDLAGRELISRERVIGIGVDTTGSTPIPVDSEMRPLALNPKWSANPAAHAWLWKDHTGADEAAAITAIAREHAPQYLAVIGGTYSSEWFWSKIWRCLKVAPDVFDAARSWVELADYIPAALAGVTSPSAVRRGICAPDTKRCFRGGRLPSAESDAPLIRKRRLRGCLFDHAWPSIGRLGCSGHGRRSLGWRPVCR